MQGVYLKASAGLNRSILRVTHTGGCTPKSDNSTWNWIGLKKVWTQPVIERQKWIGPGEVLAVSMQCRILAVTRSVVYDQKKRPQKDARWSIDQDNNQSDLRPAERHEHSYRMCYRAFRFP